MMKPTGPAHNRVMLLAAALGLGGGVHAQAAAPIQWGCDAPVGRVCYFSVQFATGGARNFSLTSGRKTLIFGVTPGRDQYIVSVDAPNLGDLNRCKQLVVMGRLCQVKAVDPNYND